MIVLVFIFTSKASIGTLAVIIAVIGQILKGTETFYLTECVSHFCPHRYIFLFDKVVIVCKRKGYNYELKEIIELQFYKMSDDPTNNRDMKKVEQCQSVLYLLVKILIKVFKCLHLHSYN